MHVYIEDIGQHDGDEVTIQGWLHNRRSSGKIHFLTLRDGTGFIQAVMSKAAVGAELFKAADHLAQETSLRRHRHRERRRARARADTRSTSTGFEVVGESHDYPITPKEHGVDFLLDRRHLWIRTRAPAGDPARPPRDHQRGPRLLQRPRLHPRRHADLHAGRVRGHDDAVSGAVLRRSDRVPDAERPAVQRSECDGARPRLLLRSDVPRGKVEDATPPHRVLDGRAGNGVRRSRTTSWIWPRGSSSRSSSACSNGVRTELKVLERDATKLESVKAPFPRISYDEAVKRLQAKGPAHSNGAAISAARTKPRSRRSSIGR